jgi:hypothetical protein
MASSLIDWEAVDAFLEAIGRSYGPIVLALFPPQQGPCIHFACEAEAIPTQLVEAAAARNPRHSLGMVINPPAPTPDDWGAQDAHYHIKPDGTRGRLKAYGAQQDHIPCAIAIWAEGDGGLPIEAQEAIPSMIGLPTSTLSMWTGGKSLHHYWSLTPGQEITPDQFRNLQKRLALAILNVAPDAQPDESLSNPNRVMRLPGAKHPATGAVARIHSCSNETFTYEELDQALPPLPATEYTNTTTAEPGKGIRSQWFNALTPMQQRALAVELLSLLPPRHAPGTNTYPVAFATLAALVHQFGVDEAIAICDEAHWSNEHWDPAKKAKQIGPAKITASIGKLIARAESEASWTIPPHLPPYADPLDDILNGFTIHEEAPDLPPPPPRPRILSRHQCRDRLEQAVDDDLAPADIELLIDELASSSDLSHFTLKALLSAVRHQAQQLQIIESQAEQLNAAPVAAPQDQIFLPRIFPPLAAFSLQKITQHLPYSDAAVAMAFLATISGLVKLGTSVCGNPITQYTVPTNLYVCTVASTGQKKTPLQKLTIDNPTVEIRRDLARQNTRAMESWREQCQGMKRDERPPQPTPIYLQIQDYTGEALAAQLQALEAKSHSILVLRDELSGLFGSLNQYRGGRGADEQQLLELFDGSPYTSLRISSADRSFSQCHVSIYGGIQPELLRDLIRGGDPSGKWARFLFSPLPQRTQPLPVFITDEDKADVLSSGEMLQHIAGTIYRFSPRTYHLDPEALIAFSAYEHVKQQEALSARLQAHKAIRGKAGGKVLRVAGLLHLLWATEAPNGTPSSQITSATLQTAIDIVEAHDGWALGFHEIAISDSAESPVSTLMRRIHSIAQKAAKPMSWREISRGIASRDRQGLNVEVAHAAMEALARHGYGAAEQGPRGGLTYTALQDLPATNAP